MTQVSPMLVLLARAEARAILYAAGELGDSVVVAVTPLLDYAYESGVIDAIGEAEVHAIVNAAFGLEWLEVP
jgi:hypothetical protein